MIMNPIQYRESMICGWIMSFRLFKAVLKSPYLVNNRYIHMYHIYIYIYKQLHTYIHIYIFFTHQKNRQYQMNVILWYCKDCIYLYSSTYIHISSFFLYVDAWVYDKYDAKATGVAQAALGGCHLCSPRNRWTRPLGKTFKRDFPCSRHDRIICELYVVYLHIYLHVNMYIYICIYLNIQIINYIN